VRPLLRISAILSAMLPLAAICSPQTDPKNVPQPPTTELKKFDPFLGKYQVSGDFANLPWTGTLELKKVIKGCLVIENEFERDGKKFVWPEVYSDITSTSFLQTADIGEKGAPLKRWVTIHATRVNESSMKPVEASSAEAELRAIMDERRKARVTGDTEANRQFYRR
jgi:hypothetical protein